MEKISTAKRSLTAFWRLLFLFVPAVFLLAVAAARDDGQSGEIVVVDNLAWNADGVVTCSAAGTDDAAYSLSGYKLPSTSSTYKINTGTFPANMLGSDVQNAINSAFATVDAATSKALYVNGGATTAKPGIKDGVNAVGFGSLGAGLLGQTTAWVDSKSHLITEFDVVLATAYTWSTNVGKTGDCGGDSTAFDVQNVMTHEAGHTTGLNDKTASADHAQTMYTSAAKGELLKRTLANGDVKGIVATYGP